MTDVVAVYSSRRPTYEAFCFETRRILEVAFRAAGIPFHTIEARAKSIESFKSKTDRKLSDGTPKYSDPLTEITDLSAVRIITYTLADVIAVSNFLSRSFTVIEKTDLGEKRFEEGRFGYHSIHFLIKYSEDRLKLPEVIHYTGLVCEIQVRTILQHAWAEIEHDVQYKNQSGLPSELQRKFTALAGLLEIADREFQSIQDLDDKLKRVVTESLQEDLTRVAIAAQPGEGEPEPPEPASVRQLIRQGRFEDAARAYDDKIATSPTMHTLFIGRAKARFLSGDRAGAIEDIQQARELNPDDPAIVVLQRQVQEGLPLSVETDDTIELANDLTRKGNESMESGDGAAAFEYFSEAQELGASRPFSLMNKAMACVIAADVDGAKIQLSTLQMRVGTPFSVVLIAMYCIIYAVSVPDRLEEETTKLKMALMACDNFALALSPLPRFRRGLARSMIANDLSAMTRIQSVFDVLEPTST